MNKNDGDHRDDEQAVASDSGSSIRHSRSSSAPTTHVIYTKTSCYFCSEWLENDSFKVGVVHNKYMGHTDGAHDS